MSVMRPLIFLEPISDTFSKLKTVIEATAENDGVEIFELQSVDEISTMLKQIGQSLILVSNPKLCVLLLKSEKKLIKKLGVKIILLSKSAIKHDVIAKLMKAGLTEHIVEPVAPKTLIYKVKLHLRSIVAKKQSKLLETKKSTEDFTKTEAKQNEKDGKKKNLTDKIDGQMRGKINQGSQEEDKQDLKNKTNTTFKQSQDSHYKGKLKQKENIDEDDKKNEKSLTDLLEADKETDTNKEIRQLEEEIKNLNKAKNKSSLDIDLENAKNEINNDDQEDLDDLNNLKRLTAKLDIEDENESKDTEQLLEETIEKLKKKRKQQLPKSDNHYKGSMSNPEEENDTEKKRKRSIDNENNKEGRKSNYNEQIDSDNMMGKSLLEQEIQKAEKTLKKRRLSIEEDQKNKKRAKAREEIDELEKKKKKELKLQDDNLSSVELTAEEIEEVKRKHKRKKLNIDDENSLDYNAMLEVAKDKKRKKQNLLSVQEENERERENQESLDEILKKHKSKLNIKEIKENAEKKEKQTEDESPYARKKRQNKEEDKELRKSNYKEKEENKINKSNYKEVSNKNKASKADAHSEKIQTHYSNKKSIKHGDDDWDEYWKKSQKDEEELSGIYDKSIFYEKKMLGEQTIDYKKMKDSFDIYSQKKKTKNGSENALSLSESNDDNYVETFDFDNVTSIYSKKNEDDKNNKNQTVDSETFFKPNSFGFNHVINILEFYDNKNVEIKNVASAISKIILNKYNAYVIFYSYNKNIKSYNTEFNSYLEEHSPQILSEPDKLKLAKSDYKAQLKEYKNSIKENKIELEELNDQWQEIYGDKEMIWQDYELPYWKDKTFQNKDQEFIYPIKEGLNKIGYISVIFNSKIEKKEINIVEIILESSRGLFLEWAHKELRTQSNYNKEHSTNEETKIKRSMKSIFKSIGSFFSKKAA